MGALLPWVTVYPTLTSAAGQPVRMTRDRTRGLRRTVELEVEPGRWEAIGFLTRVDRRVIATPALTPIQRPGAHIVNAPTYEAGALALAARYRLVPVLTYRVEAITEDTPDARERI